MYTCVRAGQCSAHALLSGIASVNHTSAATYIRMEQVSRIRTNCSTKYNTFFITHQM